MPKFQISICRTGQSLSEPDSFELIDLDAARDEAIKSAREIVMNAIKAGDDDVPDSVLVADASGRELLSVRLIDVIPGSLRDER